MPFYHAYKNDNRKVGYPTFAVHVSVFVTKICSRTNCMRVNHQPHKQFSKHRRRNESVWRHYLLQSDRWVGSSTLFLVYVNPQTCTMNTPAAFSVEVTAAVLFQGWKRRRGVRRCLNLPPPPAPLQNDLSTFITWCRCYRCCCCLCDRLCSQT